VHAIVFYVTMYPADPCVAFRARERHKMGGGGIRLVLRHLPFLSSFNGPETIPRQKTMGKNSRWLETQNEGNFHSFIFSIFILSFTSFLHLFLSSFFPLFPSTFSLSFPSLPFPSFISRIHLDRSKSSSTNFSQDIANNPAEILNEYKYKPGFLVWYINFKQLP